MAFIMTLWIGKLMVQFLKVPVNCNKMNFEI